MVNTGKPSEACYKCRERRIKCDEERPSCQRCQKRGLSCLGYPNKKLLIFRDHTSRVRAKAEKKSKKDAKNTASVDDADYLVDLNDPPTKTLAHILRDAEASYSVGEHNADSVDAQSGLPSLAPYQQPVNGAIIQGAVATFMERPRTEKDVFWAAFDCVPSLYQHSPTSPAFSTALNAISLMNLSMADGLLSGFRRPALEAYGRSLKSISTALKDPCQRTANQTLMAIELICLFEATSGLEKPFYRAWLHLQGMNALLAERGDDQFTSIAGRRLFLTSFLLVNTGVVAHHGPVTPAPEVVKARLSLRGPAAVKVLEPIWPIIQQGFNLRACARELFALDSVRSDVAAIELLLARLKVSERKFTSWIKKASFPLQNRRDASFTRLLACANNVLLQDLKLRCYQHLETWLHEDQEQAINQCVVTAKDYMHECETLLSSQSSSDDLTDTAIRSHHRSTAPEPELSIFQVLLSTLGPPKP